MSILKMLKICYKQIVFLRYIGIYIDKTVVILVVVFINDFNIS